MELVAREVADPDQERTHTRSALQACRLSVQKYNPLARGDSRFLTHQGNEAFEIGARETAETDFPVDVVMGIHGLHNVVRTERCGFDLTGRKGFGNFNRGFHGLLLPTNSQKL